MLICGESSFPASEIPIRQQLPQSDPVGQLQFVENMMNMTAHRFLCNL
jgi:hypothetical protein